MIPRTSLVAALLVGCSAMAAAQEPSFPLPTPGWGPSWVGGRPASLPGDDGSRKPDLKVKQDVFAGTISGGSPRAVTVTFWGDVAELKKGTEYQLRYQLRLHTKKGERGPLLGTTQFPTGVAYTVTKQTFGGGKWYGLERDFDLTRKELSGMTGLPEANWEGRFVFIRVEPQIYDATNKKYTSPEQTPAIIVVALMQHDRCISAVWTLAEWIAKSNPRQVDEVIRAIRDLGAIDQAGNRVANAMAVLLDRSDMPVAAKVKLIRAVPKEALGGKLSYEFIGTLNKFAEGYEEDLKAAAQKKLDEMRN